jgi:hypothetical protein
MNSARLLLFVCVMLGTASASAQSYALRGHVPAGGGAARGGVYQLDHSFGQPHAGPRMTGGCWAIDPGFWSAYAAVPTPEAPTLQVRPFGSSHVRVSFTPGCRAWVLQWTRTLQAEPGSTVWTDDPASNMIVLGDALARDFHVPSWGPRLFFRLRQASPP